MEGNACLCAELWDKLDAVIAANKGQSSALIQVLHWAQENIGYLPREVQVRVAEGLGVSLSEVYGVVSFYTFFSLKPRGRWQISCCKGTACYVRGAPQVLERFEKELGIKAGDTTNDGEFSLEVVRCLGACGLSPVITVNHDTHARMKSDLVPGILNKYKDESLAVADEAAGSVA